MFIVSKDKLDNYEIDRCLINDKYRIQYCKQLTLKL